jgi:hypothetical protein
MQSLIPLRDVSAPPRTPRRPPVAGAVVAIVMTRRTQPACAGYAVACVTA